ncbi:MAG: hypothetical protein N3A69_16610, partial [Leptospiraceae bacterium]|nr:hypothetical protein [Leptospiraceae bacterium]
DVYKRQRDSLTEQEQSDLADGLVWIREVLLTAAKFVKLDYSKIRPIPQGNTVAQTYANLLELGEKLNSSSNIENFLENLRDLKLFVMSLTGKIMALAVDMQTLTNVIKAYSQNMDVLKNEFVRVNENLQAGKEIVAGQILSHATERLQVLLHAIIALQAKLPEQLFSELEVEGMTLEEAIEKLKVLLSRVVRSFEANDLVSAGDILEYELPDVLDRLVPFLRAISNS